MGIVANTAVGSGRANFRIPALGILHGRGGKPAANAAKEEEETTAESSTSCTTDINGSTRSSFSGVWPKRSGSQKVLTNHNNSSTMVTHQLGKDERRHGYSDRDPASDASDEGWDKSAPPIMEVSFENIVDMSSQNRVKGQLKRQHATKKFEEANTESSKEEKGTALVPHQQIETPEANGKDKEDTCQSQTLSIIPANTNNKTENRRSVTFDQSVRASEKRLQSQRTSSQAPQLTPEQEREKRKNAIGFLLLPFKERNKNGKTKSVSEIIETELMGVASDVDTMVVPALQHIAIEASLNSSSRKEIAVAGGIPAIIKCMERHARNVNVQISACQALEKLALDDGNELVIGQLGGVDSILAAMMGHFDDATLHQAAWSALWNLMCLNATRPMTVDTAGGIQAIILAMKHHVNDPKVQKNACGALSNLCLNNDARMTALAEADGFVAISQALQQHWNDPDVQYEANNALVGLLENWHGATWKKGDDGGGGGNGGDAENRYSL